MRNKIKYTLAFFALFAGICTSLDVIGGGKGGAFNISEPQGIVSGSTADSMNKPLAIAISNFFGWNPGDKNGQGAYTNYDSAFIAVNVIYIISEGYERFYNSDYMLGGYNSKLSTGAAPWYDDSNKWLSANDPSPRSLEELQQNSFIYGNTEQPPETCRGENGTFDNPNVCTPIGNSMLWDGTRNYISMWQYLKNQPTLPNGLGSIRSDQLLTHSILFDKIVKGFGYDDNVEWGSTENAGVRQEKVIYFPHRYLDLIHVEAIYLRANNESNTIGIRFPERGDRRIVTFTYVRDKSEDVYVQGKLTKYGTNFKLLDTTEGKAYPADGFNAIRDNIILDSRYYPYPTPSISWGNTNPKSGDTSWVSAGNAYSIKPHNLRTAFDVRDVEAIHVRLGGQLSKGNWACLGFGNTEVNIQTQRTNDRCAYISYHDGWWDYESTAEEIYRSNFYICPYPHDDSKGIRLPSGDNTFVRSSLCDDEEKPIYYYNSSQAPSQSLQAENFTIGDQHRANYGSTGIGNRKQSTYPGFNTDPLTSGSTRESQHWKKDFQYQNRRNYGLPDKPR